MYLAEDLKIYTEIREHSVVTIENLETTHFEQFNPTLHETEDYPILLEISQKEVLDISLNLKLNWVKRYIDEKNIGYLHAKQA